MATLVADPPDLRSRPRDRVLHGGQRLLPTLLRVLGIALVARLLYGPGLVTNDPMWSLAWGEQIANGVTPALADPAASTAHPLPNLVAAALSVFGPGSEGLLHVSGFLAVGFVGDAVHRLTRVMAGAAAGAVAVVLTLTRPVMASYGALAVCDIPFCALVLYAAAVAARRPRAGVQVLGLLAIAGLIRPEAWLLSGAYWLWLWRRTELRTALRHAPLVVAAPVTWTLVDLAFNGDALFSLHATRDAAAAYGRITGVDGLLREGVHVLGYELRPTMLVLAVAGFAALLLLDRLRWPLAITAVAGVSVAVPVAAGTPLNGRYLMVVVALCCAAAAAGFTNVVRRGGRLAWIAAGLGALLLLAGVPDLRSRLGSIRSDQAALRRSSDDARALVQRGVPCLPVSVTGLLLRPAVAVWSDVDLADVTDPTRAAAPDRGTFLIGTAAAADRYTKVDRAVDDSIAAVKPPADARVIARRGGWTLLSACSSPARR